MSAWYSEEMFLYVQGAGPAPRSQAAEMRRDDLVCSARSGRRDIRLFDFVSFRGEICLASKVHPAHVDLGE